MIRKAAFAVVLAVLLWAGPARADIEQPSPVPPGLEAPVAARLSGERAQIMTRLNALLAQLEHHNSRCTQVRADDASRIRECQRSQAAVMAELTAYRQALAAYEGHVRAALESSRQRHRPSGNGLIGGTGWRVGYYSPVGASPEVRARALQALREQSRLAGRTFEDSIDFDRYNFVLGIAVDTAEVSDLTRRVLRDQLHNGYFAERHREAYNALRDRQFGELGCHSNGAMVCLAALEMDDVRANDVILYGPQITPEALEIWDGLVGSGRIRSLTIYINENDPVPPMSLLVSSSPTLRIASRPRAILFDVEEMAATVGDLAPRARVQAFACDGSVWTNVCHGMNTYADHRGRLVPR